MRVVKEVETLNPNENTTSRTFSAHAQDNDILGLRASACVGQRQRDEQGSGNEIGSRLTVGPVLVV